MSDLSCLMHSLGMILELVCVVRGANCTPSTRGSGGKKPPGTAPTLQA